MLSVNSVIKNDKASTIMISGKSHKQGTVKKAKISTYEQAKEEFDALCTQDRFTRAYMRMFCDYAGIVLAILPICHKQGTVKKAKISPCMP